MRDFKILKIIRKENEIVLYDVFLSGKKIIEDASFLTIEKSGITEIYWEDIEILKNSYKFNNDWIFIAANFKQTKIKNPSFKEIVYWLNLKTGKIKEIIKSNSISALEYIHNNYLILRDYYCAVYRFNEENLELTQISPKFRYWEIISENPLIIKIGIKEDSNSKKHKELELV